MNDIETRLRDALAARAELVRPEELRPTTPVVDPPPAWRRPGPLLLVAAAAALVVAVPVTLMTVRGGDDEVPDATDTTTSAPLPTHWWERHPDGLPDAWAQDQGVEAGTWLDGDLDGDGTSDQVRLSGSEGSVSLQLEAGGRSLTTPVVGPVSKVGPLTTIEGSDTVVIPVAESEGAAGTTYTTWHLYLVRDGQVVEAAAPGSPMFGSQTSNLTEAEGGTDTWRTWVDQSGGIVTMSYDDDGTRITDNAYPGSARKVYRNTFYRWSLDGTDLVATRIGQGCTVRDDTTITACP
ncbi:hypothetical protein [Nocardioides sp. MH1]|uniref:hypothetical protein n=1 Tax=Nocardioides sp. MH1 TaxID=3242490 RepID=UPI003521B21B